MTEKKTDTRVVTRLNYEQYQVLEKLVGRVGINSGTSVHEVAFQLGIQHVLQKLREGYVTGEPRDADHTVG